MTDIPTPKYEWHIEVQKFNHYGDRIVARTPMVVIASTHPEVTTKVRAAFGATYDDFRKFWSHTWSVREVREKGGAENNELHN